RSLPRDREAPHTGGGGRGDVAVERGGAVLVVEPLGRDVDDRRARVADGGRAAVGPQRAGHRQRLRGVGVRRAELVVPVLRAPPQVVVEVYGWLCAADGRRVAG